MISLHKPTVEKIERFLADQSVHDFTYAAVGATAGSLPSGYVVDHTRIQLGEGEQVYLAAKAALRRWDQFRLDWLEASPSDTPIEKGRVIAVVARVFGLWWINASRIISVVDEDDRVSRFGFAYGTLPAHVGTGEERFLIEWNRADNSVWYDILAFSKPNYLAARLGYPVVRRTQKRFGKESGERLRRVAGGVDQMKKRTSPPAGRRI